MSKLTNFLFAILIFQSISAEAQVQIEAQGDASPFCPILDLNASSQHYHEHFVDLLFSDSRFNDELADVGISSPVSLHELRLLTTEADSAVCQKINERTQLPDRYRYDRELDRYVLESYVAYYELRNRYIVFQLGYTPGSTIKDVIGPPASGFIFIRIYDKINLNLIGRISI